MDHRVCCVDSRASTNKLFYDTDWQTKEQIVRIISDLSRSVDMVAPEIPVWIFWLYKYDTERNSAFNSLETIRQQLFKAIEDKLKRENGYPRSGLDYLPKKQPSPKSRCYSFLIGPVA